MFVPSGTPSRLNFPYASVTAYARVTARAGGQRARRDAGYVDDDAVERVLARRVVDGAADRGRHVAGAARDTLFGGHDAPREVGRGVSTPVVAVDAEEISGGIAGDQPAVRAAVRAAATGGEADRGGEARQGGERSERERRTSVGHDALRMRVEENARALRRDLV
jgi:predicted NAD-dependent protein-ADP-ribosyltransferase YbiA (DUF1768 family)